MSKLVLETDGEDYWTYQVRLSDKQSIVGFPKALTIGIGFSAERDPDRHLPHRCRAEEIYNHIKRNKGDKNISNEDCIKAIRMIQDAVRANPWKR